MKKILLVSILCAALLQSQAQVQPDVYAAFTIPDSMRKDADVVLREEYIKFNLKGTDAARYEVHEVYTILNEHGKEYLDFSEFSSKFSVLDDAEIKVYDAMGVKKNTYSKKEMISLNYGEGLVPEGKVTYFRVSAPAYPFTFELNYSIKFKGTLNLPGYIIQPPGQAVQHSVFEVEVPSEQGIRYKLVNTDMNPVVTHDGNRDIYRWEVNNLPAYKSERKSGSAYSYEPAVFLAPNKFQLDDYDGDMTSWKNFGAWINNLYAKTTSLSDERKSFYQSMVKDVSSPEEKARIIYNYMQNNMRYVSIQLGIGGFRPFPASFVDDKKYGDCKALSNYLKSALDAVGIRSNVAIVQGSMSPRNVLEDFPADYFNHVILCIPQPKDSIWLECTSTTLPFGELGPFTENRKAMIVNEEGGALVNTPRSKSVNNVVSFVTTVDLTETCSGKVKTVYKSKGDERDNLLMGFHDMKDDDKRKFFISEMGWKQPDYVDLACSQKSECPYVVTADMEYEKAYAFKSGSKYFLAPRYHPVLDEDIPETKNRKRDYYFTCPYRLSDTTYFKFPAGFSVESLPPNRSISQPFGKYNCTYTWDANTSTVSSIASLEISERVVKAADYQKLLEFKKLVENDNNEKIVVKKE